MPGGGSLRRGGPASRGGGPDLGLGGPAGGRAGGGGLGAAVAAPSAQRQNLKITVASQTARGGGPPGPHPREAQGFLGLGVQPPGVGAGSRGQTRFTDGKAEAQAGRRNRGGLASSWPGQDQEAERGESASRRVGPCRA